MLQGLVIIRRKSAYHDIRGDILGGEEGITVDRKVVEIFMTFASA